MFVKWIYSIGVLEMFIKQPFDEFLKLKYKHLNDKKIHVTLPVQDVFINSLGVIHGGVISSLADVAQANLIRADEEGVQQAVTVDLNVSFLKPATGANLNAIAQIIKQGRTLIHTECLIYNDKDEKVAKSKAILFRTNISEK